MTLRVGIFTELYPPHVGGMEVRLSELAKAVGVHPVTLARGFRKAYGCSVGAYLRWLRVARAARALGG